VELLCLGKKKNIKKKKLEIKRPSSIIAFSLQLFIDAKASTSCCEGEEDDDGDNDGDDDDNNDDNNGGGDDDEIDF
jgi:hypothetical protein